MEQGDQTNVATRSRAEQAGANEDGGLAWVGMQWRMDGYCGRANGQQQCGSGSTMESAEPQSHPQQPAEKIEAELDEAISLPSNRRSKPVRRGPNQKQVA
jgi:hypothetical protein